MGSADAVAGGRSGTCQHSCALPAYAAVSSRGRGADAPYGVTFAPMHCVGGVASSL
jgi:hypothetical protein